LGQVANAAFLLGTVFGIGLTITFSCFEYIDMGLFLTMVAIYHMWEFTYVALFHPKELSAGSFLLIPNPYYLPFMGICIVEYFFERWYLFPTWGKGNLIALIVGFGMVLGGQVIRSLAMYTAGTNFHHLIREEKEKNHKLVTFGVYAYLRHPAYFGWFWWSVGTQVLLFNPISIPIFAYGAWRFFAERIPDEEETLIKFFGADFERYRSMTPVGIPFIK